MRPFINPEEKPTRVLRKAPLPTSCLTWNPRRAPAMSVMMFTVPPTEAMARFEAPSPRCTWIDEVASPSPSKLDQ